MKKLLAFLFALISISSLFAQSDNPYMLWYKSPAANWNEALPVGNGRLGAMVFGNPLQEHIQLNEESLWAGKQIDNNNPKAGPNMAKVRQLLFQGEYVKAYELSSEVLIGTPPRLRSYQTLGDLYLDYGSIGPVSNYKRTLDLTTGIHTTSFQADQIQFKREVFISAPQNCMVIRLTADKPGSLNVKINLSRERDASIISEKKNELVLTGQVMDIRSSFQGEGGAHMKFSALLKATLDGGQSVSSQNAILIKNANSVLITLTAATDYNLSKLAFDRSIDPKKQCERILSTAGKFGYDDLLQKHVAEYKEMFDRVAISLGNSDKSDLPTNLRLDSFRKGNPDPQLVALFFQYGRYLLMSSSRSPGVLPANLQGVWNDLYEAPWNSDYHTNINIQMNYWPAEVANLMETSRPFINFVDQLRVPGRVSAKKMYNAKGWMVHHTTDIFGKTALISGISWGTSPLMGAWLGLNLWEHFLFNQDTVYLKEKLYPILKETADFIETFLITDSAGFLVSSPSISPENAFLLPDGSRGYLSVSPTVDIELINELYTAVINANELLRIHPELTVQLKGTLSKLPPIPISKKTGRLQEWRTDFQEAEPGHRHFSHLISLYPGAQINSTTPDLMRAAATSLEHRIANKSGTPGWSCAWLINCYARLKDNVNAHAQVNKLLSEFVGSNLLNNKSVFQIDGNLGGVAGIAEMLLQSHNGEINLLPALPDDWNTGSIKGLRARGGFEITMQWQKGKLISASLLSTKGGKCVLRYNDKHKVIDTKAGQVYNIIQHF